MPSQFRPTDAIQSNRFICEGGLDSTQNYLNLSANKPGCATRLVNYEVGLNGGYRRVDGYAPLNNTYQEVGIGVATGKVLGIIIFENTVTGTTQIIAARKNLADNNYQFYLYNVTTGWGAIVTGLTHAYTTAGATVDKLRYAVGNDGTKNFLAIVDGVNNAVLYDGTTWAFIDSADTGAAMATAGGNQAINAPFLVAFFSSTLFIGCDLRNNFTGIIAYSAPNAFYDWTAANGAGQLPTGHQLVDMKPFRDALFTFGSNSIRKAIADVTAGFLIKDVTTNIGCASRDSVVEIGGDLVFLAPDGFRPVAGTDKIGDVQLETISKQIQKLIQQRVVGVAGTAINSVVIRGKSQFRYFFGDDSFDASAAKGLIAGLRTSDQAAGWEFGELLGFRCSCVTSHYIGGDEYVIHGDYDGKVYRQELGNDLNGGNLISIYSTPYLDLNDTTIRKGIDKLTTFLNGEGNLHIDLTADYDWGSAQVLSPTSYNIDVVTVAPMYDEGVLYDSGATYSGVITPVYTNNIEGSFFSVRFTFTTSGVTPAHSVHGFVLQYKIQGDRNSNNIN